MNILIIHQNFPGQFRQISLVLHSMGHELRAISQRSANTIIGINNTCYKLSRGNLPGQHPFLISFESAVLRGEAVAHICQSWKKQGYFPDVIIAHSGWGESLFLKDIWPDVPVIGYFEYFYHEIGAEIGFDPEFPVPEDIAYKLRVRNSHLLASLESCDIGITPTYWQHSRFPESFRQKIRVIHEGINTDYIKPLGDAWVQIRDDLVLRAGDEVITFINRNFEPTRGYHQFMRALPRLLRERPKAHVVLIGGSEDGYGRGAAAGKSHKQIYLDEVRDVIDLSRVHFVGKLPFEIYLKVLQISAVHVYLTYPFILSWSLLEAMSAGCAVVASRTAPVEEVVRNKFNGLLVDFFHSEQLVNNICYLLDDHGVRAALKDGARGYVVDNFDFDCVCKPAYMDLIKDFIE